MTSLRTVLLVVGLAAVGACSSAAPGSEASGKTLRSSDYGSDWPLTVDEGVVTCEASAVYFTTGGRRYAVNGMATGRKDAPDIDVIWKANPALEGTKINIGPIIDEGLKLCE